VAAAQWQVRLAPPDRAWTGVEARLLDGQLASAASSTAACHRLRERGGMPQI